MKNKILDPIKLRKALLTLLYSSHSGHIGSSLSVLEMLASAFKVMKKNDRLLLSKGHATPALYVVLRAMGLIKKSHYLNFHKDATYLPAHPPNNFYDIIPFPTGSLGHGLSLSVGMAQGYLLANPKEPQYVYCVMSDGECNEGAVWEAAQYASSQGLFNVCVLIDRNGIQAFGKTKDVLGDAATRAKWQAFGFEVEECDGHNTHILTQKLRTMRAVKKGKPRLLICHTIKGHGVSFMENTIDWHYLTMNEDQYKQAIQEQSSKLKS